MPDATVNEYAKNWLDIKKAEKKPRTSESYGKSIEKFLEFLGHDAALDISLLTKTHVTAFRNNLARKVGPGTENWFHGLCWGCSPVCDRRKLSD